MGQAGPGRRGLLSLGKAVKDIEMGEKNNLKCIFEERVLLIHVFQVFYYTH